MSTQPTKTIILRICEAGVFYNPTQYLKWSSTNFPTKSNFNINPDLEIYWEVEMLAFNRSLKQLTLEITNYAYQKISTFQEQIPSKEILNFKFIDVDWILLKSCFSFYRSIYFKQLGASFFRLESDDSIPTDIDENKVFRFEQSISKIEFKMGYVETYKAIPRISNRALIQIYNPYIIPEFEYIKSYFSTIFKTRKITIHGYILDKNVRSSYKFYSPQVDLIDADLIDGIKKLEIQRKIKKPAFTTVDKNLFTPNEYFDGIESELGNRAKIPDEFLMKNILELEGIRNRKQLEYISGYLHSDSNKIYFTTTPSFGFLFYIQSHQMNHYIWELLDSNATYVWSYDNAIPAKNTLQQVTTKLNTIQRHGRSYYLQQEKNDEVIFNKINHDNASSNFIDGFPRWQKKLAELLV